MTDISLPVRFAETDFRVDREHDRTTSDFRVGRVFDRTASVLSRNFLTFFVVTAIAQLPYHLLSQLWTSTTAGPHPSAGQGASLLGVALGLMSMVLGMLSQAVVLYGAFEDMRGRPVNLGECLQIGWRRFFPIIGLSISMAVFEGIAALGLVFPALILATMWFIATPACVVEQLGPMSSMRRSSQLTKGHRWKIFGLMILLFIFLMVVSGVLGASLSAMGGTTLKLIGDVLWSGVSGAVCTITVIVTYHDLRMAKEGIDVEQVASVFD